MSHKLYSLEIGKDYTFRVTFFNGDVKSFDVNLLVEAQPEYSSLKSLEGYFEKMQINRAKDCIQWPDGEKIDCEVLWFDGAKVAHHEIEDAAVRFADTIIDMRSMASMSQRDLEKKTGVKQAEISKIERAEGNPSLETMQKLYAGFGTLVSFDTSVKIRKEVTDVEIPAALAPYLPIRKKQGEYTIFDIEDLPEEVRVELIDGVIYDMATPTLTHQFVISELHYEIRKFIENAKGKCIVLESPIGVWFEEDDKNFLEPDLLIACNPDIIKYKGIVGAPDFVLEVLSPSTVSRDIKLKRELYLKKGVRELWLLDPIKKRLIVFEQNGDVLGEIHLLTETVEVKIYDGKLKIDLKPILDIIERYEEK